MAQRRPGEPSLVSKGTASGRRRRSAAIGSWFGRGRESDEGGRSIQLAPACGRPLELDIAQQAWLCGRAEILSLLVEADIACHALRLTLLQRRGELLEEVFIDVQFGQGLHVAADFLAQRFGN